jgi:putative peptidoglycan lipid II flippase
MQAPLGVFGQALAIAAFPALSQFFAQKKMDVYRDQLAKSLRQVAFLSVPISVLLIAIPHPIIQSVFEHGRFDAEATERTAACLQTFSFGIAAWCMHPILMRGYFAMQRTLTPILMGTGATAVFMVLIGVLRLFRADYSMYPLAGSFVAILLIAVMLVGIRKAAGGLDMVGILTTLAKTTLASVVAVAPLFVILQVWSLSSMAQRLTSQRLNWIGHLAPIVIVGFLCVCFAWLYYFLCRKMKMPETEYVNRALKRKTKPEVE